MYLSIDMPSIRELQYRRERGRAKQERFACFAALLSILDGYTVQTIDASRVRMSADINVFSEQFEAEDLFLLTSKLFDWLATLPKGIWDAKQKELEVLL